MEAELVGKLVYQPSTDASELVAL